MTDPTLNHCIEFHDSTVQEIRWAGADAVVEMKLYVHASTRVPGVDAGSGWYQPAEMVISDAVLGRTPSRPLWVCDGTLTLDRVPFENVVPFPFDRAGQVRVVLIDCANPDELLDISGSRVRFVLKGTPGTIEQFRSRRG